MSPTPEPTVAAHLAKATGTSRNPTNGLSSNDSPRLPNTYGQRPFWSDWSHYIGGTLITIYLVDDDAKPSEVTRYGETCRLDLRMLTGNFSVLPLDHAATLRLVNTMEAALTQCRERFFHGMPNYIGRTPREV